MDLDELNRHRRTVATADGEIAFVEVGEGPAALFVHGVFLNAGLWRNVIEQVCQAGHRRCVAIDLPAHGRTRVKAGQDLSLPAQADILERFCQALDLSQVDVVANDTGGAAAQVFAVRHTDRVRTLTLTNCDTHDNLPPARFKPAVELARAGQLAPLMAPMLTDLDLARSELALGSGYQHPDRVEDEVIRSYLEPCLGTPEAGREIERFIASLEARDLVAVEPGLRQLEVPTLVVWGTGDVFFELSWAHWLRDTIPGVTEVVEVEGAKLFFPEERAGDLVAPLLGLWAGAPATR